MAVTWVRVKDENNEQRKNTCSLLQILHIKSNSYLVHNFVSAFSFSGHPMHSALAICILALPLWKMWLENYLFIIPLSGGMWEKRIITLFLIPVCLKRQQKREGIYFYIPIFILADLSALLFFKKAVFVQYMQHFGAVPKMFNKPHVKYWSFSNWSHSSVIFLKWK